MNTTTLILIHMISITIIAFILGKYSVSQRVTFSDSSERIQWNKLIKNRKILKPKNINLNHYDYWSNRFKP